MSYPGDVIVRAAQFVRLMPVTLSANTTTISTFGTPMDFPIVDSEHPKKANLHEKTEYNTRVLSGGDTLKHPKNSAAFNAADGSVAAKSDNADSLKVSIGISYAHYQSLKTVFDDNDMRMAACIGYGRIANGGTIPAYLYIMGKPLGDLEWDLKDDFAFFELTIEGGEVLSAGSKTVSDFNTAMKTGSGTGDGVTLLDQTTVHIPALVNSTTSSEWDDLLAGKLVDAS
jgi:hypothetical protein